MAVKSVVIGKILYAILFCVFIPALLIWWATQLKVQLPVDSSWRPVGIIMVVIGSILMADAMWRLWKNGKGLPMNAFPPVQYVQKGSYQLFYHPIYVGFCLTCAGTSILFLSPAGLYVMTPMMIILCTALVYGYEKHSLIKRFGKVRHHTFFGSVSETHEHADFKSRLGAFCSTFIPWLLLYQIIILFGKDATFIDTMMPLEKSWQVFEMAEIPYAFTYIFVGITPFIISDKSQLRTFQHSAWCIIASGIFFQFVLPFYAEPRVFEPTGWLGEMHLVERKYDGTTAAFPSFHVLWALLAAVAWSNSFPILKGIWWFICVLIILSCIAVGVHSLADVVFAILLFVIIIKREKIWAWLNSRAERLANSWREWHLRGLRIINHSVYAGLAAMVAVLFTSQFGISLNAIVVITFCSLLGGALWGQFVEGSPRLLRPFGYYGAIVGGMIGIVLCKFWFNQSIILATSAIALTAPWVQALGRLRCLVQGCCHGSPSNNYGISYTNKHSRVFQIPDLKEKKIHNTQLYSICFNILIGLVLLRLWYGNTSPALLGGLYFILSGAARFVEEAYRGEPQTKVRGGLRIYQWLAIASVVTGILVSTINSTFVLEFTPVFHMKLVVFSLTAAFAWAFGMGMDFPKSTIRFSRLTG